MAGLGRRGQHAFWTGVVGRPLCAFQRFTGAMGHRRQHCTRRRGEWAQQKALHSIIAQLLAILSLQSPCQILIELV